MEYCVYLHGLEGEYKTTRLYYSSIYKHMAEDFYYTVVNNPAHVLQKSYDKIIEEYKFKTG